MYHAMEFPRRVGYLPKDFNSFPTEEERKKAMEKEFNKIDTNGDGENDETVLFSFDSDVPNVFRYILILN